MNNETSIILFCLRKVLHGNLEFRIGRLKYPTSEVPLLTILLSTFCALVVVVTAAVLVWYNRKYSSVVQRNKELLDGLRSLQHRKCGNFSTGSICVFCVPL